MKMCAGHLDLTSFRTIIHDWFDERALAEQNWEFCEDWGISPPLDEQAVARQESFLGKIKQVVAILKSMKKDTEILSEALLFWFALDRANFTSPIIVEREIRENLLYMMIQDYFHGQGYQIRSERIGRGRQAQKFNPPAPSVCLLCGKPIKGAEGAKVYHCRCLYDSMKEVREKTNKPV